MLRSIPQSFASLVLAFWLPVICCCHAGQPDSEPPLQKAFLAALAPVPEAPASPLSQPEAVANPVVSATPVASEEGRELSRLEALPPAAIPVEEATLASAINLVATAAGMNFVAPAAEDFPEPVTLSTRVNPWRLLQLLSERYRFSMHLRGGVWLFDREPVGALVSKTYRLLHTNLDNFKASQNAFNMLGTRAVGSSEHSSESSGGLVFTPQTQKIIDDLRELVGLPAASLVKEGRMPEEDVRRPVKGEAAAAPGKAAGKVLYLPDVNALYVTATRQQHEHVAEYLRIVDQPVRQVRIEAKFFETTHDPKTVIGIDPAGYQPGITLSNISTKVDLGRPGSTPWPDNILLAADSLRFQLQALQTDDRTRLVNSPCVVVANNREAYFSVGDEEPFVSANSYNPVAADGGFGSTQAQVAIRRIGTSVNLVPTLFPGEDGRPPRIRLAVRIEVGVLKGFRRINTVDIPVVSSQKYEYTVFLRSGETLAFGGMSGVSESDSDHRVPVVGDIPLLGRLFRSHSRSSSQRNLVAYITATLAPEGGQAAVPPAP
jgi:hypothetical protein